MLVFDASTYSAATQIDCGKLFQRGHAFEHLELNWSISENIENRLGKQSSTIMQM